MKHVKFLFIAFLAMSFSPLMAQKTNGMLTDSILVNGVCSMCKTRIEKNLKLDGISSATWNKDAKMLVVSYDPAKMTNDAIQKKVASLGHDTEKYRAEDSVYGELPSCCHYDRDTEVEPAAVTNITESIYVNGACGMCKTRIQKTVTLDGVSEAIWNKDTKMLLISYDPNKITNDQIQMKIAAVGHDTDKYKADDTVYEKLPGCCHYDRVK